MSDAITAHSIPNLERIRPFDPLMYRHWRAHDERPGHRPRTTLTLCGCFVPNHLIDPATPDCPRCAQANAVFQESEP